tara:strand:- start:349 stop:762 length:414 start_codon:yes stop_codon:yes gene_type:complete
MATYYNTNYVYWGGTTEQAYPALNNDVQSLVWGSLDSKWNDVQIVGATKYKRRDLYDSLRKRDLDRANALKNAKKYIRLISRILGDEVYTESKETNPDIKVNYENIKILNKPILEKNNITLSCELNDNIYTLTRELN